VERKEQRLKKVGSAAAVPPLSLWACLSAVMQGTSVWHM
jgi:hypothetical protein